MFINSRGIAVTIPIKNFANIIVAKIETENFKYYYIIKNI